MQFIKAEELFNRIKELINSGEKSITVITKELSDEIAELLLAKASKGVKVSVITKDTNWADWLESKKNTYGIDEIKNYMKEIEENERKERLYKNLEIVIPIVLILALLGIGLLFLKNFFWAPLAVGAIISGIFIYFTRKTINTLVNQSNVLKALVNQRETEIEGIRKEIEKNLYVKVDKRVGFTVVIVDGKGIITPLRLCKKENLEEITYFDELSEKEIEEINKSLGNSL